MKLRIRGNSIRLRLTKSEVETFAEKGLVKETTDFGNGKIFAYAILSADVGEICADFADGKIEIKIPKSIGKDWAKSDEIGIETGIETLKIIVEKDFKCLSEREGDDDTDAFPHPIEKEAGC